MDDPSGTTLYSYDRRGLLRQENHPILGSTYLQRYGYDATAAEIDDPASLGLIGIRERAHLAGGTVQFEGVEGRGRSSRCAFRGLPRAAPHPNPLPTR